MVVSGLALVLACVAFIGYDWMTFRNNTARNLSTQAEVIAANTASAVIFDDPDSAQKSLDVLRFSPNVLSAGIHTADQKAFASYFRPGTSEAPRLPVLPPGQPTAHAFQNRQSWW